MSYSSAALTTFDNMVQVLDTLARKAEGAGLPDSLLVEARLADDMFPLETQFRIAINQINMAVTRVWGLEIPLDEAPYESFAEVRARLSDTKEWLAKARDTASPPSDTPVDYTLPNGMRFVLATHEYLRDWTYPNLYFHATTAYGLLRQAGLELGKADFVGHMMRYHRPVDS